MPATMPKMTAAVLVVGMLALAAAPARSGEPGTPDDTARFLAGLSPAPDSALAALTKGPLWQQHARYFDAIFEREDSTALAKIRAFSQQRLTDQHETMLYMFSGPDFLYATSFFPNASTYVLSGLEPVGDIPQLTGLTHPTVERTLRNLESSLGSLLSFSFFITRNMKTQLREGPVYGTLPILYVFLARTGKTVHDVSFVSLDEEGNFEAPNEAGADSAANNATKHAAENTTRKTKSAAQGVKIVFSDGGGPSQTLYYFSTNLADDGVKRSGFLAFCDKLGVADSLLKSASYLLHSGGFNTVRDFLLDRSATILQDDSGIPLAYFDPKKWRLQPFGHYVGPLSIFGRPYQARMGELFRKDNAIPIDFGIGYRWRRNESNLLLAEKTAPNTSESELAPHLPTDRYHHGTGAQSPKRARAAVGSPQSRRKRVESESTGSLGCRIAGIFPFCSAPQTKSSR
jgi:hypothetical protein